MTTSADADGLRRRIRALAHERDHLADLLKACQIAGFLPEGLDRRINSATAEESEGDIARRRERAEAIVAETLR